MTGSARAADGHDLAVTRFPAPGAAWGTLVIAGAMGVRQDFYAPIARFLAANGAHVLTFDYRGVGASRTGSLAACDATVTDWAEKDLNAMLREARAMAPDLPLLLLGHSLGGQLLGVLQDNAAVAAAVTVTAGSGYYRFNERMRVRVRIFWFLAVPLLTPLFGYFPGKALRMVGDLPRGVAWQWRRWCLDPEYLLCEGEAARIAFARVHAPILSFSFADDALLSRTAIESLNGFYRNAHVVHRHVAPSDVGARSIGHFGFFSDRHRDGLWREALEWLRYRAAREFGDGRSAQGLGRVTAIPREILGQAAEICGALVELVPLPGLSPSSVALYRGARGAIVIKRTNRREAHFYRDLRAVLLARDVDTPRCLFAADLGGASWLGLEYVPRAFPMARFPFDAEVIATLAAIHAMPVADEEPHHVLDWSDADTRKVAAQFGPRQREVEARLRDLQLQRAAGPDVMVWGDSNPLNWAMRDNGRPVLLDWQRWGRGRGAFDLAGIIPGLGDGDSFRRVADAYASACVARSLAVAGARELAEEIRRAKAWAVVELLSYPAAGGSQLDQTQSAMRSVFADWLLAPARVADPV